MSFLGKMQTCLREVFVLAVLRCLQDSAIEVLKYWGWDGYGDWEDAAADAVGGGGLWGFM